MTFASVSELLAQIEHELSEGNNHNAHELSWVLVEMTRPEETEED